MGGRTDQHATNNMRRQLTDSEKTTVLQRQQEQDGSLRCFISGEIISDTDDVEYDHIQPDSKEGETSISNLRIVLKKYNRKKSDQSLYDARDNLRLERLFESKRNHIKLQDILDLKDVQRKNIFSTSSDAPKEIAIDDGSTKLSFPLLHDPILGVDYFYGKIPISWLENDDQEGLQPRVIDYKRLIGIRDHLKLRPQLAPSIARLLGNHLKLFDGQHKLAAQVLNNSLEADVKVYVSPQQTEDAKKLFDDLMITNLEAHSKLKQVPFYTSTLLDRLSVIYKDLLEEFIATKDPEDHTEEQFIRFLVAQKQYRRGDAKEVLRSAIKSAALNGSPLAPYVAEASKDAAYPVTIDLLDRTVFPVTLYLEPSQAKFTSEGDYRNAETQNFSDVCAVVVQVTKVTDWEHQAYVQF
jgi:HNH endonuclease